MKYVKMLGLLAVAAAALMAFAGTASATLITSPAGTPYTGVLHAKSIGHAVLHGPIGTVECNSTVEGHIEKHGKEGEKTIPASGPITTLHFTGCTGSNTVTSPVKNTGTLSLTSIGGGKGTLRSTGAEVIITAHSIGATCIYTTNNTVLGTVTDSNVTKGAAKLDIEATIPRTGGTGGVFCGSTGSWTGTYEVTKPNPLIID